MALCFLSFLFPLIREAQSIQIAPWKYITHTQQSCQETLSILCETSNTHISFIFTLACTWIEIFISACIPIRTHSVGWCCHYKLQQHLLHCKMPEKKCQCVNPQVIFIWTVKHFWGYRWLLTNGTFCSKNLKAKHIYMLKNRILFWYFVG